MSTIGIIGMGGMGHRVAAELNAGGHRVLTCLAGRSDLSKMRAAHAGAHDVDTLEALVGEAEIILSIMPPEDAASVAAKISAAFKTTGSDAYYVDCNAISPQTSQDIDAGNE
jgi:3-hydroxyisobutyrate dehydrogenase-like beta-hydroxyacid dehydrogenase|tara:strand:+ start:2107 stop:2442 length:336 start_codon:yes stop_codon:yes gene_type:complete